MNSPSFQRFAITVSTAVLLVSTCCQSMAVEKRVQVAVFQGDGVGPSVNKILESLNGDSGRMFEVRRITADQIRAGQLSKIDVLIHPGGSGSKQGKALGAEGRAAITKFVDGGGGFLGVCAGAYLATNDYTWSLNLIDAKAVDRKHWARGTGTVTLSMSPAGSAFFGHTSEQIDLHFGQGPLLGRREWDDKHVPDYQSLAIYKTGIAEKGAPAGIMPGTSAIVRTDYGAGRVFCFSPHPEMTEGRESMITTAVSWLAQAIDEQAVEITQISEVVGRHILETDAGGIGVLITQNGKVLHRKGYGFVKGRHLSSNSPLSLASVTKQFAAMCAAMLIEEGRLDSKQQVSHYLPDFKPQINGRELLVQDLLWHTSGLANFIKSKEKAAIADFKKQRGFDYLTNENHAEWLATMKLA